MGDFTAIVGGFTVGLRSCGVFSGKRLTLVLPFGFTEKVRCGPFDASPGGIYFCPPGAEHDIAYFGRASYAAISVDPGDLATVLGGEPRLSDPEFWIARRWLQPDPQVGVMVQRRLNDIVACLDQTQAELSPAATDFWRRSIIEAISVAVLRALPPVRERAVRNYSKLVRDAERYLEARSARPVHISEICRALNVSRRGLHRAFEETLGVGPIAYLRRKQLHAVYSALARGDAKSVTDVALEHGFTELGRLSRTYNSLFGELPSQTLRRSQGSAALRQ
ncbi:AraC family transcriptional regulator [Bradyrhizobium tropiciagri]|uniref:AraC family transcriptional regulator n=1 Tax=Bradyrhizobium tropiciagri TaxID=312253 RepID=UPI001BA8E1C9|nr:helix-turn-helix domain-containing protein [Bradyrhizobium tropiciagri]MBR0900927.1 AraC family transcriptional regulator [Bradyrhizobium tropiciagri]